MKIHSSTTVIVVKCPLQNTSKNIKELYLVLILLGIWVFFFWVWIQISEDKKETSGLADVTVVFYNQQLDANLKGLIFVDDVHNIILHINNRELTALNITARRKRQTSWSI